MISQNSVLTFGGSIIFDNVKEGWLRIFLLLSFTTGMRVGEVLGLKWKDFDLDEGILYLKRTRRDGLEHGSNEKKNHERTIPLFPNVLEELKVYAKKPKHEEYLFVSLMKKPWYNSRHLLKNHIKPFFEEIGVPYKTLKTTRASFITAMIKSEVNMNWLQSTVGHSKGSSITIKHYFDDEETIKEKQVGANIAAEKLQARLLSA